MAFGETQNQKKAVSSATKFDPVFLKLPVGERIIRIVGKEVQVKRYFFDGVNMGNGKKEKKPIFVARLEKYDDNEWDWIGSNGSTDYWDNPINDLYTSQYTKEEITKKGLYPATRFYVNILDRSPVIKLEDGTILWSESYLTADGEIKEEYKKYEDKIESNDMIMILEQSSGKIAAGGKHFFQQLLDVGKTLKNRKGKPIKLTECDIKIVGFPTDDTFAGNPVVGKKIYPESNQDEIPDYPLYNLYDWLKPWPNAAIQEIVDGKVYSEVVETYGIQLFPQKEGKVTPEEDLPF